MIAPQPETYRDMARRATPPNPGPYRVTVTGAAADLHGQVVDFHTLVVLSRAVEGLGWKVTALPAVVDVNLP